MGTPVLEALPNNPNAVPVQDGYGGHAGYAYIGEDGKRELIGGETGFGRETIYGQFPRDDEYNGEFYGVNRYNIFREMGKSDGGVAAMMAAYALPIVQADWSITGGTDEQREWVEPQIMRSLTEFLRKAIRYLQYGNYAFEQVLTVEGGRTAEQRVEARPPWTYFRFVQDSAKNLVRIEQLYGIDRGYIPADRLVLFVNDPDGEGYLGNAILRPAWKHWLYATTIEKFDAIGIERLTTGVPFAHLPPQTNDETVRTIDQLFKNVRTHENARIVLKAPMDAKISVLFNDYKNDSAHKSIDMHRRNMYLSVLQQFLILGGNSAGSYALSSSLIDFFSLATNAVSSYIAETINEQRIKRLIDLNWSNVEEYPVIKFANIDRLSPAALGQMFSQVGQFLTWDDGLQAWLREKIGAPKLGDSGTRGRTAGVNEEDVKLGEHRHDPGRGGSFWRDLTAPERFVKLGDLESEMDTREADVRARIDDARRAQVDQIVKQLKPIVARRDFEALSSVKARKKPEYKQAILRDFWKDHRFGFDSVTEELERQRQGKPVVEDILRDRIQLAEGDELLKRADLAARQARQRAIVDGKADDFANEISESVTRTMRARARASMADPSLSEDDILDEVRTEGLSAAARPVATATSFGSTTAMQMGRELSAIAHKDEISSGFYSAILDGNTCEVCEREDGKELTVDDPTPPVPNPACLGTEDRCRCIHVWVIETEIEQ